MNKFATLLNLLIPLSYKLPEILIMTLYLSSLIYSNIEHIVYYMDWQFLFSYDYSSFASSRKLICHKSLIWVKPNNLEHYEMYNYVKSFLLVSFLHAILPHSDFYLFVFLYVAFLETSMDLD